METAADAAIAAVEHSRTENIQHLIMLLSQCTIELRNVAVSDL